MYKHLKTGIIQNAPLTADFSNNLRSIVQGYRYCIDHGAELVIAPATALCGPKPAALSSRSSFLQQTQAALNALSHELSTAPLLLAAYSPLFANEEDDWGATSSGYSIDEAVYFPDGSPCIDLVPFLLEKDTVTELSDAEVSNIAGLSVYVDICSGEILPDTVNFDLIVHLSDTPWHTDSARQNEETRCWEASSNDVPVIWAQAVGTAGTNIYGGGSGIYSPSGKTLMRLPFFEPGCRVANIAARSHARALPRAEELLRQALALGIRDTTHQNGYNGVCLPLDHKNSPLLAALSVEALGSANVQGITFGDGDSAARIAKALGINVTTLESAPLLEAAKAEPGSPLAERLQAALFTSYAEEAGLMQLCPLGRHEVMLGSFTSYGDSCGQLAPLGNLYRMDIHLLTNLLGERYSGLVGAMAEPTLPAQDRIIHELADRNVSASELLANNPILFSENEVRHVQRRIIASASKRAQLPTILHVDAPAERLDLPLCHRMND